jgi:putative nucleotidyltransferase with HDIG domain
MISSKVIAGAVPWSVPQTGPSEKVSSRTPVSPSPVPGRLIFRQESINALLRTLSARDPYTCLHSGRVTNLALAFARALGLTSRELETLTNAGYLHDIGKIGVSDNILLKPGPLTVDERQAIEAHPLIGYEIVEPLGLTTEEKNLILLHHEHWNGHGYPYGLKGEEIPFLVRILALADVFDALTSDRPYRRAYTTPQALAEIELQAGEQFDPELTQKFIPLVKSLKMQMICHTSPASSGLPGLDKRGFHDPAPFTPDYLVLQSLGSKSG